MNYELDSEPVLLMFARGNHCLSTQRVLVEERRTLHSNSEAADVFIDTVIVVKGLHTLVKNMYTMAELAFQ